MTKPTKLTMPDEPIIDKEQIKDLLRLCDETKTMEVLEEGKIWK